MTDTNILRECIAGSGLKSTYIADRMNISYQSLLNKLSNKREFKQSEIVDICNILNINNDLREQIFFSKNVDI